MTPKEKARDLINKFSLKVLDTYLGGSNRRIIECALIAVDEVLNDDWFIPNREDLLARKEYWEEVKKEINNL